MNLPFLKQKRWPKMAATAPEPKHLSTPYDHMAQGGGAETEDDLLHQVTHEFMSGVHSMDHETVLGAFRALVHHVRMEDGTEEEAEDPNALD